MYVSPSQRSLIDMPKTMTRTKRARRVIPMPRLEREFALGIYLEKQRDESWRVYGHGWYDGAGTARPGVQVVRRVRLGDFDTMDEALSSFPMARVKAATAMPRAILGVVPRD
jgi:hypothetical protein